MGLPKSLSQSVKQCDVIDDFLCGDKQSAILCSNSELDIALMTPTPLKLQSRESMEKAPKKHRDSRSRAIFQSESKPIRRKNSGDITLFRASKRAYTPRILG